MSESYHIHGICEPDAKWKEYQEILSICERNNVETPAEVQEYFEDSDPELSGVTMQLGPADGVTKYSADMRTGFDVEIAKLPDNVTKLRFFVSY